LYTGQLWDGRKAKLWTALSGPIMLFQLETPQVTKRGFGGVGTANSSIAADIVSAGKCTNTSLEGESVRGRTERFYLTNRMKQVMSGCHSERGNKSDSEGKRLHIMPKA
jgi:hypothetical protein